MNPTTKRIAVTALTLSIGGLLGIGANEGLRTVAYQDEGGVWTNGYGHTGKDVYKGQVITEKRAEEWLAKDVDGEEKAVRAKVKVPLHQYEYDALVDFVHNVGPTQFSNSTLLKVLNQKRYLEACDHYFDWLFVKGRFSRGILNRRIKEYKECTGINRYYVTWSGQ